MIDTLFAAIDFEGHRHTWGLMSTEMQGRVVWMCRARGFKDFDEYETAKGFEVQRLGHTITAVFEPDAVSPTASFHALLNRRRRRSS